MSYLENILGHTMFRKHLDTSKATYLEHLAWAVVAGVRLIYAGITSIIHGVIPTLFDGTAPKQIIDIYHNHLEDHPNPKYKNMINDAKDNK
jgi:hypothetical protein